MTRNLVRIALLGLLVMAFSLCCTTGRSQTPIAIAKIDRHTDASYALLAGITGHAVAKIDRDTDAFDTHFAGTAGHAVTGIGARRARRTRATRACKKAEYRHCGHTQQDTRHCTFGLGSCHHISSWVTAPG